ncbi:hypothetical protein O6H91_02G084900 [Diphasiastrum complanatum]|uniref:Uncharacterized protein n=2 Tax=Diphasiastrum complanatum TaxID=34168 RepID=A0ACC2EHW5_DIPCM|nr:hypothetical protein O6H91_Y318800 [Diphasiastrum complanatum]KAJ7286736.1 hypothetical protein O6H91_Y318800 [Diphasiastrum complanatum]KAJ7566016.1 hypothetical protein O6H91_02G084900 [Diphasiastrum complanatum]KAJ7566017.1 hypothetical protein O6H91_02G084900 [Diphasiastrum complanatum]
MVQTPGFEGFEKRLELEFFPPPNFVQMVGSGLRLLTREQLDKMLRAAECTIVSELSNEYFDSYVLSESSLFVYPLKIVLKTCGTTQLLKAIPVLLDLVSPLFLKVRRCKYTRGTFLFPAVQPYPYNSFAEEVKILDDHFGNLGSGGKAFVMGDKSGRHDWHVYMASAEELDMSDTIYTVEMCMTQLDPSLASQFFKVNNGSAEEMTKVSGIGNLLPHSRICDFAFDPCGYSMNGIEDGAHSTIHITPEDGFSYASFEVMGYSPETIDLEILVDRVLACFKPGFLSVAVGVSGAFDSGKKDDASWNALMPPSGYRCDVIKRQRLPGGNLISYYAFKEIPACSPISPALFSGADTLIGCFEPFYNMDCKEKMDITSLTCGVQSA